MPHYTQYRTGPPTQHLRHSQQGLMGHTSLYVSQEMKSLSYQTPHWDPGLGSDQVLTGQRPLNLNNRQPKLTTIPLQMLLLLTNRRTMTNIVI